MLPDGSRYRDSSGSDEAARGVRPGPAPRSFGTATGVMEHRLRAGDRLDLLARHYYGDDRLWWRLLDANPELLYGGDAIREHPLWKDPEGRWSDAPSAPDTPPQAVPTVGRTLLVPAEED